MGSLKTLQHQNESSCKHLFAICIDSVNYETYICLPVGGVNGSKSRPAFDFLILSYFLHL